MSAAIRPVRLLSVVSRIAWAMFAMWVSSGIRSFDGEISQLDTDVNFISSTPVAGGGSPAGWVVGTTQVGEPVTVVMAGAPGWEGCLVAALSPGPIEVGGYIFPIGPDWVPILTEQIPATGFSSLTFVIPPPPPSPELGGLTVYGLVVAASPDLRTISSSEGFAVFVEFSRKRAREAAPRGSPDPAGPFSLGAFVICRERWGWRGAVS